MSRPTSSRSPARLPSSSAKPTNPPVRLPSSSQSPSKLPSVPRFLAKEHSHTSSAGHKHRVTLDASVQAAVKQIGYSLANLDFDRFFTIFAPHTPVYQFIMELDLDEFRDTLSKAFPGENMRSSNAQEISNAKKSLDADLVAFDCMFKRMEDKGLHVGNIRTSLAWVRKRNSETYATLPQPETEWFGKKSLELPNKAWPAFIPDTYPDEVTTLDFPVPKFDPSRDWEQLAYKRHAKSGKTASKALVDHNAANRDVYHHHHNQRPAHLPTVQGTAEQSRTYVRFRSGGIPASSPSNSQAPSSKPTHSRAHHDTPRAPVYYHHSVAPPSPPRRRECYPVQLSSERSHAPSYSHPHYHHQGYYEEPDQNLPFIPPSPYSKSRGHQSPRQRG